jgi:hypothetical protein
MKPVVCLCLAMLAIACTKSTTETSPDPEQDTLIQKGDSAKVIVVNGYGSGTYKIGDTVHIWSTAIPASSVFDKWTGMDGLLHDAGEWHNTFIMPAKKVTVTGSLATLSGYQLKNEQIRGMNTNKNVYYYFPAAPKGMIFLLHGTNGNATNLVNNYEWKVVMKDLAAAGYAVVVTDAEEVTLRTPGSDGLYRWALLPMDSTSNVDYANIKALRDTFYARGYSNFSVPVYSMGMSDGGAFSCTLSALYKYKAGISYCAPGFQYIFNTSTTPFLFCMAKNDDNAEVGQEGNADALAYMNLLTGKGVCSKFYANDRSPVYPERFASSGELSVATSTALFNDLKNNDHLDTKNYLRLSSDSLGTLIKANAGAYPAFSSLTVLQTNYVYGQIDDMCAVHQFYSDLSKTTIKFLNSGCQ